MTNATSENCYLLADDSEGLRPVADIVIKTLAIHILPIGFFGHYMSLCRIPSTRLAVSMLIAFAVAPPSILALFAYRAVNLLYRRPPGATWGYRLAACCGVWASLDDQTNPPHRRRTKTIPLVYIDPRDLESKKQKKNKKWAGRICLLVVAWVQASLTSVLYFRRLHANACSHVDIINGTLAVGSFFTQSFSIVIMLLNTKWSAQLGVRSLRHLEYSVDEETVPIFGTTGKLGPSGLLGWGTEARRALELGVEFVVTEECGTALFFILPLHVMFWGQFADLKMCVRVAKGGIFVCWVYVCVLVILLLPPILCLLWRLGHEICLRKRMALPTRWSILGYELAVVFGLWSVFVLLLFGIQSYLAVVVIYKDYGRARWPLGPDAIPWTDSGSCNRTFWSDPWAEKLWAF